jgi:hypothetical protein
MHTKIRSSIGSAAGIFLIAMALGGIKPILAQSDGCDATAFKGAFGYSLTGSVYDSRGYVYLIGAAGRMVSDGAGTLTGADTVSFDGSIAKRQYTGTYTVNSDCTGSLSFKDANGTATNFDFVLANDGKEVNLVQTDPSWIVTATLKKQVQQPPPAPTPAPAA